MFTGMMWYDNDPKTNVLDKVNRAVEYYQTKYGRVPDVCLVNPTMIEKTRLQAGKILVRAVKTVRPNYFWIGVEEKKPLGAD
jgi:hypothetical protein